MMIAEPVQELVLLVAPIWKSAASSLSHPALHRALWCAGHLAYVSRAKIVSVFIQCYFRYCVVLAFSAHSEQCDILVCSNHETCLLVIRAL